MATRTLPHVSGSQWIAGAVILSSSLIACHGLRGTPVRGATIAAVSDDSTDAVLVVEQVEPEVRAHGEIERIVVGKERLRVHLAHGKLAIETQRFGVPAGRRSEASPKHELRELSIPAGTLRVAADHLELRDASGRERRVPIPVARVADPGELAARVVASVPLSRADGLVIVSLGHGMEGDARVEPLLGSKDDAVRVFVWICGTAFDWIDLKQRVASCVQNRKNAWEPVGEQFLVRDRKPRSSD